MTKGLFTTTEEIHFQGELQKPVMRFSLEKKEKFRPLFTSPEEIQFQHRYVQGNVVPLFDPNAKQNPVQAKRICSNKKGKKVLPTFSGRTR